MREDSISGLKSPKDLRRPSFPDMPYDEEVPALSGSVPSVACFDGPFERTPPRACRSNLAEDSPDSEGGDCSGMTPTHIQSLRDRMMSGPMTPMTPVTPNGRSSISSCILSSSDFGVLNGETVQEYILTNCSGVSASVITYGATLTKLLVKDRGGIPEDVVCGFETLEQYTRSDLALGALCVSRAGAGVHDAAWLNGLDRVIWRVVDEGTDFNEAFVRLRHVSVDTDGAELAIELSVALTGYAHARTHRTYTYSDDCTRTHMSVHMHTTEYTDAHRHKHAHVHTARTRTHTDTDVLSSVLNAGGWAGMTS
jgi:hypothetical protein